MQGQGPGYPGGYGQPGPLSSGGQMAGGGPIQGGPMPGGSPPPASGPMPGGGPLHSGGPRPNDGSRVITMVDARDVHKSFHHNEVLRGISMQIWRQEVVVLLGPSGSGKTTFLRCINHLEKIDRRPHLGGWRADRLSRAAGWRVASRLSEPTCAEARRDRHGLPALQSLPASDGPGKHHRGADAASGACPRAQAEARARELLAKVGLARQSRCLSEPALGRPAAARRHRPRAGDGPEADALRRAHLRAGPRARRRGARRSCASSPTRA